MARFRAPETSIVSCLHELSPLTIKCVQAVFGNRLKLHPVVVLFGLVFWNMLWGILGALLSVPIMSAFKIGVLDDNFISKPLCCCDQLFAKFSGEFY